MEVEQENSDLKPRANKMSVFIPRTYNLKLILSS